MNKKTAYTIFACLTSSLLGFLAYNGAFWAPILLIPFIYIYSIKQNLSPREVFYTNYFLSICFFVGAVNSLLPKALMDYALVSGVVSLSVSILAISYNALYYFGIGFGFFFSASLRPYISALGFTIFISGFPNFIYISPGDFLPQYQFFEGSIKHIGTIGTTFLATLFCLILIEIIVHKKTISLLKMLPLFCISFFFIFINQINQNSSPITSRKINPFKLTLFQTNTPSVYEEYFVEKDRYSYLITQLEQHLKKFPSDIIVTPESGYRTVFSQAFSDSSKKRWAGSGSFSLDNFQNNNAQYFISVPTHSNLAGSTDRFGQINVLSVALLYELDGSFLIDRIPKKFLVPLAEYIPFSDKIPFLEKIFPWAAGSPEKREKSYFEVFGTKIASLICYDSVFRDSYKQALKEGAQFALVMTNDASIREEGATLHYLVTYARQLEYGLPAIYVGNKGYTGIVTRGVSGLEWNKMGFVNIDTQEIDDSGPTFYYKHLADSIEAVGTYLFYLLFLIIIILLSYDVIKNKKKIYLRIKYIFKNHYILGFLLASSSFFLVQFKFFEIVGVPTGSMYPTISPSQKVILCKFNQEIKRNDMVSFLDKSMGKYVIKRVVATNEDLFEKKGNTLFLNKKELTIKNENSRNKLFLESTYLHDVSFDKTEDIWPTEFPKLEKNQFFVLGDSRSQSRDSRSFGPIEKSQIKGKVCHIF